MVVRCLGIDETGTAGYGLVVSDGFSGDRPKAMVVQLISRLISSLV